MDASHDVSADRHSSEQVRSQIHATAEDLAGRISDLEDYIHRRFGSVDNPFHLKDIANSRPLLTCGVALFAGLVCGRLGAHRTPLAWASATSGFSADLARGLGRAARKQAVSALIERGMRHF